MEKHAEVKRYKEIKAYKHNKQTKLDKRCVRYRQIRGWWGWWYKKKGQTQDNSIQEDIFT